MSLLACSSLAVATMTSLSLTAGASASDLYAYAGGAAKSPSSCPRTTNAASECTLAEALSHVAAGGSVLLATGGKTAAYEGNFTIGTSGTSATASVTIGAAPGVSTPVINGDASGKVTCPTSACDGAVFTVKAHVFADIRSVTILGGDNTNIQGGGGIDDLGTLSVTDVAISGCSAPAGGAIALGSGARSTVTGSAFSDDQAAYFGGAINSGSVVGTVAGSGTLTVTGSTFTDDRAPRGGAIDNGDGGTGTLTVTDSTFDDDSALAHGGAVDNGDSGTGTATVTGSTFSHDSSANGGAIDDADSGGKGTLTVTGSTFNDDSATDGGAIDNAERGHGTVTARASTFDADSAKKQGSALDTGNAAGSGSVAILNSTIDNNLIRAAIDRENGTVEVAGSIIAGTMANCSTKISDGGYNLITDATAQCGFSAGGSDLVGVNPHLGPLAHNGGPTLTMEPSSTSPVLEQIPNPALDAVNAGVKATRLCPVPDQRGDTKYEAYGCAIGSVDPASGVPVVTSLSSTLGPAAGKTGLTIRGGNFAAGATVWFGAVRAAKPKVVSATVIKVTVPALPSSDSAMTVAVTVTNKSGLTSPYRATDAYRYYTADWSSYLGGASHSSYNPAATSISPASIPNLQPIWRWTPPSSPNSGSSQELASPIVSDGVIYVGLLDGYLYAISEATRAILWSDFLGIETPTTCQGVLGITSTAAVADDPVSGDRTVYINAPDGYLYALNAATGATEWKSLVGIPGSLTGGPDNYYAWGSPTVANGKVYIGISSNCDIPLVQAGLLEIDQHTGKRLAYWDSLPANVVGGSIWTSAAVLPNGDVAVSTGNSVGNDQIPEAESIVVLNGTTLKLLGSFMVPSSQAIGDSDFGGSPTVFTADPSGVATTMVGACNKNGIYYAVRAYDADAGPLWERRIGVPTTGPLANECDSAAIWNGKELIEGGGSIVTIKGTTYNGSVQALDPTTGKPVWETGLPGWVVGSPSEDGAGVIAAPVYDAPKVGDTGVYLLSASTGKILDYISTQPRQEFAQPVFDGNDLLIGDQSSALPLIEYAVTTPAQSTPLGVSPSVADVGTTSTLTLTSTGGFTSPANVIVSSAQAEVLSVQITSSTTASVSVEVLSDALAGEALNVTLVEPDLRAYSCTSCLAIGPSG
ncbi:MAG: PQQ-binding-like beta-propeller repeat protein [Acidimicrobiales bacterium]